MVAPNTDPSARAVAPADTREFSRLILPFIELSQSAESGVGGSVADSSALYQRVTAAAFPPASVGGRLGVDASRGISSEDRRLYDRLGQLFPLGDSSASSEFSGQIQRGDFLRLRAFAGRAALAFGPERNLTLPRIFAIHALGSLLADATRPPTVPHSEDRTTYFLSQFATALAWRPPMEVLERGPDPFDFATAIRQRIGLLGNVANGEAWMRAKMAILVDRLLLRKSLTRQIEAEPTVETDNLAELRRTNNHFFAELQRLRRYSIKSAVHTEGDVAWSIHDMSDMHAQMAASSPDAVQPDRWRPRMVLTAMEQLPRDDSDEDPRIIRQQLEAEGLQRPSYEDFGKCVWMDDQGELYSDVYGGMSLRQLYEAAGKPANYESLRQFLLQKYFDLTVPTELVRTAEAETRGLMQADNPDRDRQQGIVYVNLLLPRLRILRNIRNAAELDALITLEDQAVQAQHPSLRRKRQHDVEAHPARLPAGYKASPQALALAAELGIVLGPNETCVKKHKRGDPTLGEVVHRAKQRGQLPEDD